MSLIVFFSTVDSPAASVTVTLSFSFGFRARLSLRLAALESLIFSFVVPAARSAFLALPSCP